MFRWKLVVPEQRTPHVLDAEVCFEEHTFESLAMLACEQLEAEGYRFHASGFGRAVWPVDVGYDLSTVVECLPDLLRARASRQDMALDMYSQGIECTFRFHFEGDMVTVECDSRTSWRPDPVAETLSYADFSDMVVSLANEAIDGVGSNPFFNEFTAQLEPRLVGDL